MQTSFREKHKGILKGPVPFIKAETEIILNVCCVYINVTLQVYAREHACVCVCMHVSARITSERAEQ